MQKDISQPYQNFSNAVMTGTDVLTSPVTNISYKDSVAIQLQWMGDPVGDFEIQVSLDYKPALAQAQGANAPNNGTWVPLLLSGTLAAAGSADQATIDLSEVAAPFMRVQYFNASGDGVLNGFISTKSLGS